MFRDRLAAEFAPYAPLSKDQLDKLEQHYSLLVLWNKKLNLTRIQSPDDVVRLHYCESLFLGTRLPSESLRIMDVGSGGGFPGIPVAILRPDCAVDLVESHQRKAVFLVEASRSLPNVRILARRAEDIRDHYDWLIARAVRPVEVAALRLADNVAMLVGENDANKFSGQIEKIPWGTHRRLLTFHVERDKI